MKYLSFIIFIFLTLIIQICSEYYNLTSMTPIVGKMDTIINYNDAMVMTINPGIKLDITTAVELTLGSNTALQVNSGTDASSTLTGSIVTNGGIGVGGSIYVTNYVEITATSGNTLKIDSITDSSSTSTGSVITSGGIGVEGSIYVAKYVEITATSGNTLKIDSTTDSSSTSTGSIITNGGIAIAKTIYAGTGISLPTTGGTATVLNYYEEGTITTGHFQNPCTGPTITVSYVRIGKTVTLTVPPSTCTAAGSQYFTYTGTIPSRLLPSSTSNIIEFSIPVVNSGTRTNGLALLTQGGVFNVYASAAEANFGSGTGGWDYTFTITYSIQ